MLVVSAATRLGRSLALPGSRPTGEPPYRGAALPGSRPTGASLYRAVLGGTNTRQAVRAMILKSRISDQFSR